MQGSHLGYGEEPVPARYVGLIGFPQSFSLLFLGIELSKPMARVCALHGVRSKRTSDMRVHMGGLMETTVAQGSILLFTLKEICSLDL